ncbi:MAG: RNA 2',3'-cyclic phosphodiesterase [Candidatus Thorarchaeota archaeon]
MIRTFLAFELNEESTIEKIQNFLIRLKQNQPKLKTVESENLHLTVKFLGNIPEEKAPLIYKVINTEVNQKLFQGNSYEYQLKGVGQFNKFSVIWVKLIGNIEFLQKVQDITENLLYDQFKIEKERRKEFKPHLTIGRLRKDQINYRAFDALKNLINQNKQLEFGKFVIDQLKFKKSDLTPQGPIYTDLVF